MFLIQPNDAVCRRQLYARFDCRKQQPAARQSAPFVAEEVCRRARSVLK